MWRILGMIALMLVVGCGDSKRKEQTLSVLNLEADRWEGGKEFATSAKDAYGRDLVASVSKGMLNYNLELRSAGPDGLFKNSDDIVVHRSERHGESTLTKEAAKSAGTISESVGEGGATGVIKGIKKGIGLGEKEKPEQAKPEKK
jgi:hypothetical protein